jgi:hypothetical protein
VAIAVDASSPVRWTGTPTAGVNITSAAFTPPDGSLLVLTIEDDSNSAGNTYAAGGGGWTWTQRKAQISTTGAAVIFTAPVTTGASMQATCQRASGTSGTDRLSAKLYVVTGQDASPIGTSGSGTSTTNNLNAAIFTSTQPNSFAFVAGTDWNQLGVPTSSDLTKDAADYSGAISVISGYKDNGATGAQTANLDAGGSSAAKWEWAALEILPAAAGGAAQPPIKAFTLNTNIIPGMGRGMYKGGLPDFLTGRGRRPARRRRGLC